MGLEDVSVLEQRAEDHWGVTLRLIEADDEWAAVTAFYSCYQLARAALLSDPIFNDLSALKAIHENLTPDDRTATKHNAHRPGRPDFGVVDLVQALYKYMGGEYRILHRGSVSVRYYNGLEKPLTIASVCDVAQSFREQYAAGNLRHSEAKHRTRVNPSK